LKKKKTYYYYSRRRSSSSDSSIKPAAGYMKESPEVAKTTIAICESTTLIEERRNEDILEESRR